MSSKILYELKDLDCIIIEKIKQKNGNIPLGLTQIKIIEYLMNNQVAYQKDLEKKINLSRATISCVLKTMEKNKLIERGANDLDARSKTIILNEKVRAKLNNNMSEMKKIEQAIIKNISQNELDVFFDVIKKMKKNLRSEENV